MTDQIPADKVRPILDEWERIKEDADWEDMDILVQAVRNLLPAPTLADMTEDQQTECTGMQADLAQGDRVLILDGTPNQDGRVQVLEPSLDVYRPVAALVTPRPDLPRLEWPGNTPTPAPALPDGWRLADHEKYGRIVVTNPTPDIDGNVCFVAPAPGAIGNDWHLCPPDELTYLDQEADQ